MAFGVKRLVIFDGGGGVIATGGGIEIEEI
jgi:hypothetical protein